MPYAQSRGVNLYYEEVGTGTPIIFVHEFANDRRGWDRQVRFFARSHRCVAFNARGYPPSDVPETDGAYSQEIVAEDIGVVLDHIGLERAFLVGFSMGAASALHFTLNHPERVLGLVFIGGGSGSQSETRERFLVEAAAAADLFIEQGMQPFVEAHSHSPVRIQLRSKDPWSWEDLRRQLGEHSPVGSALTLRNVQGGRPSVFALEDQLRACDVATLIIAGDEDDPVLEGSLFIKRCMSRSGLMILPKAGHAVNLEEPAAVNRAVHDFLAEVEAGRWGPRDALARPDRSAMLEDEHTPT